MMSANGLLPPPRRPHATPSPRALRREGTPFGPPGLRPAPAPQPKASARRRPGLALGQRLRARLRRLTALFGAGLLACAGVALPSQAAAPKTRASAERPAAALPAYRVAARRPLPAAAAAWHLAPVPLRPASRWPHPSTINRAAPAPIVQPVALTQPVPLPPWVPAPAIPALADARIVRGGSPRAACLVALRGAERRHGLPPGLLVAIGLNESGLHAHALSIRGRAHFPETRAEADRLLLASGGRSVMAGCLQINAGVHARGQTWPLDPNAAADWAAGFLRTHYERSGDWAEVLRRWHGASPRNAGTYICRVRGKLEVVQPNSPIFADRRCAPSSMASLRRNGAAHLEIAEAR